jgi:ribosomal protein S27AE
MQVKASAVKLGEGEAYLIRELREYFIKHGISVLDDLIPICPKCGSLLDAKITSEIWNCKKCEYSQKGIYVKRGGITVTFVVGAGLVALLWWLKRRGEDSCRIQSASTKN